MKNILLVFTGGTIGSRSSNGAINTSADSGYQLIERFRQRYSEQDQVQFTVTQPLQILSENLHPLHWSNLLSAMESYDLPAFDGVIVTHGTDTLSFTAAMLGIYFHRHQKPILLLSSNLPIANPQANGVDNFICAVEFIRQNPRSPGVFVAYKNPGSTSQIHLGSRLIACLPLSGDFISVSPGPLFQREDNSLRELISLPYKRRVEFDLKPTFADITLIRPYPGLDYDTINLQKTTVILHDLYHSGTACASDEWGNQYSLVEFVKRCSVLKIPVYLTPSLRAESVYASTRDILDAGGKMLWNVTLEAAYAKLALAYGNWNSPSQIDYFLNADLSNEQINDAF